jgi:hypothetical protein
MVVAVAPLPDVFLGFTHVFDASRTANALLFVLSVA